MSWEAAKSIKSKCDQALQSHWWTSGMSWNVCDSLASGFDGRRSIRDFQRSGQVWKSRHVKIDFTMSIPKTRNKGTSPSMFDGTVPFV